MLKVNLEGKRAFVAGVADDGGFGFAIAKAFYQAGAKVSVGTWPPAMGIFTTMLERGKFAKSLALDDGGTMEFEEIVPLDAEYDTYEDIPEDVRTSKRYRNLGDVSVAGAAGKLVEKLGEKPFDVVVHSLANGSEVKKPLLETSRKGYLSAVSVSAYSFISILQRFGELVTPGGSFLALTYMASERVIPGYGGGMSSAKAALESDARVLAFEAGRKWGHRVNVISAGAYGSRAATAIGFIDQMIDYADRNAPLPGKLTGEQVGATAAFLASPMASGITGSTVYVDKGLHAMGMAVDSVPGAVAPGAK